MKNKTLLQKAKEIKLRGRGEMLPITKEHIELGLGWMTGEISLKQLNCVLGYKKQNGNCLYRVAIWLRRAYEQGYIDIKQIKKNQFKAWKIYMIKEK